MHDPEDQLVVSSREAAAIIGRPAATIDAWHRAGRLHPVAKLPVGARGRPARVYRLTDVFAADRQARTRRTERRRVQ